MVGTISFRTPHGCALFAVVGGQASELEIVVKLFEPIDAQVLVSG